MTNDNVPAESNSSRQVLKQAGVPTPKFAIVGGVLRAAMYLATVSICVYAGLLFAMYLQTPAAHQSWYRITYWVASVGLAALVVHVLLKAVFKAFRRRLSAERALALLDDLVIAATDPASRTDALRRAREGILGILPLIASAVAASQAIALSIVVLGLVFTMAGLLTNYMQVDRLDSQNALLRLQTQVAQDSLIEMRGARASSLLIAQLPALLDDVEKVRRAQENAEVIFAYDQLGAKIALVLRSLEPYRPVKGNVDTFLVYPAKRSITYPSSSAPA